MDEYNSNLPTTTDWLTVDNGGHPFLVKQDEDSKEVVSIFKDPRTSEQQRKDYESNPDAPLRPFFTGLVRRYDNVELLWVGKNIVCTMTKSSGAVGGKWDGNCILLQLKGGDETSGYRYVFVGDRVFEATLPERTLSGFPCPVGNNEVPYPVAVGEKYVYFMLAEGTKMDWMNLNKIPDAVKEDWGEAYEHMWDNGDLREKQLDIVLVADRTM